MATTKNFQSALPPLEPPFRLDREWYRWNIRRLQARLEEHGLDGIILSDVWNIIYYSGLFHSQTERPFWLFVPARGEPTFFCPGLDRDLVESWGFGDFEWYFDYPHHGPFNQVVYEPGPPVDLLRWMLDGLAERGCSSARLGLDKEPPASKLEAMRRILPEASFEMAGDLCLRMRMIKTPAEIELLGKAVALQDHLLEYGRALLLERGTDLTDYEVQQEIQRYGTQLLMQRLNPNGKPHQAVGIRIQVTCRAGISTAYPHPNQFYYHRIQKGDAIQLAGFVHVGGYVGEGYRAVQTAPATDMHHKVWDVHTAMTELQIELSRAGMPANTVASQVLKLAQEAGLEDWVYHRPAHGIGMEGHQPPFISLGDETVLEEGMVLSNEPGLYSPRHGLGYNHSNTILVGKERGICLNRVPLNKEWCWIEL